jgi:hypothetical protein
MRPAIEAGLMVLLEAAGPYMRPVLAVSITFCLSRSSSRAPRQAGIGEGAFSAFSAFFVENAPTGFLLQQFQLCAGDPDGGFASLGARACLRGRTIPLLDLTAWGEHPMDG